MLNFNDSYIGKYLQQSFVDQISSSSSQHNINQIFSKLQFKKCWKHKSPPSNDSNNQKLGTRLWLLKHPQASEKQVSGGNWGKWYTSLDFPGKKKKGEGCIQRQKQRCRPLGSTAASPQRQSSLGRGVHLRAVTGNSLTLHPYPRGRGVALRKDALALRSRRPAGDQRHARYARSPTTRAQLRRLLRLYGLSDSAPSCPFRPHWQPALPTGSSWASTA